MKNITYKEREKIEKMYNRERLGYRAIGRILNRSHSTIRLEILTETKKGARTYRAARAQNAALDRQGNKGNTSKIETNEQLQEHIKEFLQKDWSPEQISHRLKNRFNKGIGSVCTETIYSYIYSKKQRHHQLYLYLRRHRKKRRKWHSRAKYFRSQIPERVSISKRPSHINDRARFGDWETDSMIFSKQKEILSVQIERKTRLVRIHKCKNKTAEETYEALAKTMEDLPHYYFHSMTFDNGTENVKHIKLKDIVANLESYFCHPYSSWEKGAVENMNMFIRQYLPRNINLSEITDKQIYEIQEKLNNRPRKCLNFLTPNEYLLILQKTGRI